MENEQYLLAEIDAALKRIEKGNFGRCGNCGGNVSHARLVALPYARYCMDCAVALHAGRAVNMNEGRAANWEEGLGLRAEGPPVGAPGGPEERPTGGGTAVGGLAGTNIGTGEPEEADLESAMGSGTFDLAIEGSSPEWNARQRRKTARPATPDPPVARSVAPQRTSDRPAGSADREVSRRGEATGTGAV